MEHNPLQARPLMTWTFDRNGFVGVVTADTVEIAKALVRQGGIELDNQDLVPAVTSARWCRILKQPIPGLTLLNGVR